MTTITIIEEQIVVNGTNEVDEVSIIEEPIEIVVENVVYKERTIGFETAIQEAPAKNDIIDDDIIPILDSETGLILKKIKAKRITDFGQF